VTKKEIVRQIAERIHETQLKTKEIVQLTFNAIIDTLIADRRIELRNFGVFEVKLRRKRKARNPRTNAHVEVKEKFVVTFKPGKEMEDLVAKLVPTAAELERLYRPKQEQATAAQGSSAPGSVPAPAGSDGNGTQSSHPDAHAAAKKKKTKKATQA
jgi:nucleoid DNA-binding protein